MDKPVVIIMSAVLYVLFGAGVSGYAAEERGWRKFLYVVRERRKVKGQGKTKTGRQRYIYVERKRVVFEAGKLLRLFGMAVFWPLYLAAGVGQDMRRRNSPLSDEEVRARYRERANEAMSYYGSGQVLSSRFKAKWRDKDADLLDFKDEIDSVILNSSPVKLAEMYRKGAKVEGIKYVGLVSGSGRSVMSVPEVQQGIEQASNSILALNEAMSKAKRELEEISAQTEARFDKLSRKITAGVTQTEKVKNEVRQTREVLAEQMLVVDKSDVLEVVDAAMQQHRVKSHKADCVIETVKDALASRVSA